MCVWRYLGADSDAGGGDAAPEMDAEALRLVSSIRLAPAPAPITWATVSIRWGNDAVAP